MNRIALVFLMVFSMMAAAAGYGPVLRHSVYVRNLVDGSSGSGVVVAQGILTAYHVIENEDGGLASELLCEVPGGESTPAHLLRTDSRLDLALLSAEGLNLPAIGLGKEPSLGDPVWVVGCGFCIPHSVKRGVVSNHLPGVLMLDALIGPGDSGCAVMDDDGHLVGMVRALVYSGTVNGYGVAVDLKAIRGFLEPESLNGIQNISSQ